MKFSAMSRMISEKFQVVSTRIFDDIQIFSTSQLKEDFCPENSVLYFTDSFYRVNTETLQGSFLWYGNGPETLSSFSANWIQVREEDYRAVIDEINTILLYEFKSQSLRLRMIDIMMNGKGIAALVDEAAKSLNTTIALIDMSGKIITQSTPFKITDTLWAESIQRGFCPPFFIEHLRDIRTKMPTAQETHAILRHCIDTNIFYLAKRIYVSGELYGYVFFLQMNDRFSPFSDEVLDMLAQAVIDQNLKNKSAESVKNVFYNNLLIDIFHGIPSEQIKARVYAGEMKFPRRMCIAAVKPRYFQGDNYVKEKLARNLKHIFPKALQVYYRKMIILVFDVSTGTSEMPDDDMDKLRDVASQEHLVIGISNPFSKITSMNHYYAQAIRALEISGRLEMPGDIHLYKNVALYDLIRNDSEHNNIGFYCHPALSILREYDNENGSQLHDTLRSLARNGFNNNATAQEMFLHRNTLAYRKQKISSLTGVDLDDFNNQFMLKYSLMIEDFIEKDALVNMAL
mgnify:FL=1